MVSLSERPGAVRLVPTRSFVRTGLELAWWSLAWRWAVGGARTSRNGDAGGSVPDALSTLKALAPEAHSGLALEGGADAVVLEGDPSLVKLGHHGADGAGGGGGACTTPRVGGMVPEGTPPTLPGETAEEPNVGHCESGELVPPVCPGFAADGGQRLLRR